MKIRCGFVTNSSSSSFIIAKKHLTPKQISMIYRHSTYCTDWADFPWSITENEDYITGYVTMDNFDMEDYLKQIGISEEVVDWSEYSFDLKEYGDED